jgi:hypothetical protein
MEERKRVEIEGWEMEGKWEIGKGVMEEKRKA